MEKLCIDKISMFYHYVSVSINFIFIHTTNYKPIIVFRVLIFVNGGKNAKFSSAIKCAKPKLDPHKNNNNSNFKIYGTLLIIIIIIMLLCCADQ